jgi:hypothetical protein
VLSYIACQVAIPCQSGLTGRGKPQPWPANKIPDFEMACAYLFGGITPISMGYRGLWRNPKVAPGVTAIVPNPQNVYEIAVSEEQ